MVQRTEKEAEAVQTYLLTHHYPIFMFFDSQITLKSPCSLTLLTLHLVLLRGLLLTFLDFVVGPCSHTTGYAAEHNICNQVNDTDTGIISIEIDTDVEQRCYASQDLQAVIAPNKAHVIFIKTKSILTHQNPLRGRHGQTRAAGALETHLMCLKREIMLVRGERVIK